MAKHLLVPLSVLAVLAMNAPSFGVIFNDPPTPVQTIEQARDRQSQLMDSSNAILAAAEAEQRDMTDAERTEINSLTAEFDRLEGDIQLRERVAAQNAVLTAPRGRQTDADPIEAEDPPPGVRPLNHAPRSPAARVPAQPRVQAFGTGGFRNFGEFANSVRLASIRGGTLDARLQAAAVSTYGNEGAGADGGFAVPPDYRTEILAPVFNEDSLIGRTDRIQTSGNSVTFPTDTTTPWDTSGGVQAYWVAEAGAKPQSKPLLGETTVKVHTLAVLVPMTEELLEDAPAMGAYLNRKAPEKIDFKISNAIVRGSGAGVPLGYLNSPALVTQAKESGQAADTIVAANIVKMYGRLPVGSRSTAAWIIHPDAEAQLPLMTIGNMPIYLPPGGLNASPYGVLYGRPVIPHQVAETVGDLGDIALVDLKQYLTVTKMGGGRDANGIKSDVSIHLWFDQDMVAFRFTVRVGGEPWWPAAIAQRDGSNTQSPFVVLEAR